MLDKGSNLGRFYKIGYPYSSDCLYFHAFGFMLLALAYCNAFLGHFDENLLFFVVILCAGSLGLGLCWAALLFG